MQELDAEQEVKQEPIPLGDSTESVYRSDGTDDNFNGDDVAVLAYHYWEQRGRPLGESEEDWFRAQEEIRSRRWSPLTRAAAS